MPFSFKCYIACTCELQIHSPDTRLQSYEANPGKHEQPHSVHCPFPLHMLGHLRTASWTSLSSFLLLTSSITLLSHSFSRRGTVAPNQARSSFNCWSITHISTACSSTCPSRRLQPVPTAEFRNVSSQRRRASGSFSPDSVGQEGTSASCELEEWSSGKL